MKLPFPGTVRSYAAPASASPFSARYSMARGNASGESCGQTTYSYAGDTHFDQPSGASASGAAYQGLDEPASMGERALCVFLNCIPCVGLIMMFVWAFGKTEKKSKSNFFKVQLIFMGVILALYLVLFLFALGMGLAFA